MLSGAHKLTRSDISFSFLQKEISQGDMLSDTIEAKLIRRSCSRYIQTVPYLLRSDCRLTVGDRLRVRELLYRQFLSGVHRNGNNLVLYNYFCLL